MACQELYEISEADHNFLLKNLHKLNISQLQL